MWPSDFVKDIHGQSIRDVGPLHNRARLVCQIVMGLEDTGEDPIIFDFDMLINKHPHTDTSVPWHQDMAYWRKSGLEFIDTRSASCWCALDEAKVDNGCMWFVPGSHKHGLYNHRSVREGHHIISVDERFNILLVVTCY
mmetsp:Transcript_24113/g.37869  ORF Transcript_24113/g.37869 Transcript_24113/m.37869 type:complete len:139 (-) Transcript_24113:462-878(-)